MAREILHCLRAKAAVAKASSRSRPTTKSGDRRNGGPDSESAPKQPQSTGRPRAAGLSRDRQENNRKAGRCDETGLDPNSGRERKADEELEPGQDDHDQEAGETAPDRGR